MKTVIPINIIPLGEKNSYHLFISGKINNQPCELVIDTGASTTIFDSTIIPKISAGETDEHEIQSAGIQAGDLNAEIGKIEKFELGELKRTDWKAVIIDLTHVNELYGKVTDKRIAGLIGSDFLLKYKAVIDYKKKKLILRNIRKKKKKIDTSRLNK